MNKPNQLTLDFEKPRRGDPLGSHANADRLNANNKAILSDRAIVVLKMVAKYPNSTANELGKYMSVNNPAKYEWPHKILKRLADAELVTRAIDLTAKDNKSQMKCRITFKGIGVLDSLNFEALYTGVDQ